MGYLLPLLFGLAGIILGVYLLFRLWHERAGRPGLVLVVALMVAGGGSFVWLGVTELLGK